MNGMTAVPKRCFFLAWVLLLENAEIGFNAVVGDGLAPKQFEEILPFGLQPLVYAFSCCDDTYEAIDDVESGFHLSFRFIIKFDKQSLNL